MHHCVLQEIFMYKIYKLKVKSFTIFSLLEIHEYFNSSTGSHVMKPFNIYLSEVKGGMHFPLFYNMLSIIMSKYCTFILFNTTIRMDKFTQVSWNIFVFGQYVVVLAESAWLGFRLFCAHIRIIHCGQTTDFWLHWVHAVWMPKLPHSIHWHKVCTA